MRKVLIVALAVVTACLVCTSCKLQIDKVKIAGLLAGFVLDYAAGNEIDLSDLDEMAIEISIEFMDAYADEIPARYRAETLAFAKFIIPNLIRDYGLGTRRMTTAADGIAIEPVLQAEIAATLLEEFNEFHDDYRREH